MLVLFAKRDNYEPSGNEGIEKEYALSNIREFWAMAHEEYALDPSAFQEKYPGVARLLQSVYTADGRRFNRLVKSPEDLGFKITFTPTNL